MEDNSRDIVIALYTGIEGNHLVCNIKWDNGHHYTRIVDNKKKIITVPPRFSSGIKLKLDDSPELIKRIKRQRRRTYVCLSLKESSFFGTDNFQAIVVNFLPIKEYQKRRKEAEKKSKELKKLNMKTNKILKTK